MKTFRNSKRRNQTNKRKMKRKNTYRRYKKNGRNNNRRKSQKGGGVGWLFNSLSNDFRSLVDTWVPGAYTIRNEPWKLKRNLEGKPFNKTYTGRPTYQKLNLEPRIKPSVNALPVFLRDARNSA